MVPENGEGGGITGGVHQGEQQQWEQEHNHLLDVVSMAWGVLNLRKAIIDIVIALDTSKAVVQRWLQSY